MNIRPATDSDREQLAPLRHALWPDGSVEEHAEELKMIFAGGWSEIWNGVRGRGAIARDQVRQKFRMLTS